MVSSDVADALGPHHGCAGATGGCTRRYKRLGRALPVTRLFAFPTTFGARLLNFGQLREAQRHALRHAIDEEQIEATTSLAPRQQRRILRRVVPRPCLLHTRKLRNSHAEWWLPVAFQNLHRVLAQPQ